MRKDKGLHGDRDRLPMLTWIMFLKFLDDLELQRKDEAKLRPDYSAGTRLTKPDVRKPEQPGRLTPRRITCGYGNCDDLYTTLVSAEHKSWIISENEIEQSKMLCLARLLG